jgi:spore coat polysaccharide biosynthesis predicted glycosyltransferase SpsG
MNRVLLVCQVSSKIGIGHLSRLLALAETLRKDNKVVPEFLIFGDLIKKDELDKFKVHSFSFEYEFVDTINRTLLTNRYAILIFDLYPNHNIDNINELFKQLKQRKLYLIGVDALIEYCDILDLIWVPAFYFDFSKYAHCNSVLKSGWDSFLIQKRLEHTEWSPGSRILILTGGSDVSKLGKTLPAQLEAALGRDAKVHWVRGPFSDAPILPNKCRLNWTIHDAPESLDELIVQSDYVMTVFGVSFFEVLQYGIPTVVFSPYGIKDNKELDALSKEGVAMVASGYKSQVDCLVELMSNHELSKSYSLNALSKMSINGAERLSKEIYSLIGSK